MQLLSHPRQIRLHYPPAYHADLVTPRGDRSKLGTISTAQIHFAASKQHTLIIVNGYTQFHYGRGKKHTDYQAIRSVFQTVKQRFSGKRIAYPKIGCGLGGGDWKEVTHIIDEVLLGEDHTYVEFEPGEIKTRKRKPLHTDFVAWVLISVEAKLLRMMFYLQVVEATKIMKHAYVIKRRKRKYQLHSYLLSGRNPTLHVLHKMRMTCQGEHEQLR